MATLVRERSLGPLDGRLLTHRLEGLQRSPLRGLQTPCPQGGTTLLPLPPREKACLHPVSNSWLLFQRGPTFLVHLLRSPTPLLSPLPGLPLSSYPWLAALDS